jgi:hypothetical protein
MQEPHAMTLPWLTGYCITAITKLAPTRLVGHYFYDVTAMTWLSSFFLPDCLVRSSRWRVRRRPRGRRRQRTPRKGSSRGRERAAEMIDFLGNLPANGSYHLWREFNVRVHLVPSGTGLHKKSLDHHPKVRSDPFQDSNRGPLTHQCSLLPTWQFIIIIKSL